MRDADSINTAFMDEVKNNVGALRKTMITVLDVCSVPADTGSIGQPCETLVKLANIFIGLRFAPVVKDIVPDSAQIRFGAGCHIKGFSH